MAKNHKYEMGEHERNNAPLMFGAMVELLLHIANSDESIEKIIDSMATKVENIEKSLSSLVDTITALNTTIDFSFNKPKTDKNNPLIETNSILKDILSTLKEALKPNKEKGDKSNSILDKLKSYADVIKSFSQNLTDKLLNRLNIFNKLLEKINLERVNIFGKAIEKFAQIMESLQKKILPVTLSILSLAAAFLILTLVTASPMLLLNMLLLTGFLLLLTRFVGDKKFPQHMMQFAGGIAILTLAMFAMSEVPIEGMLKMLAFIAALGFEIFLMNKFIGKGGGMEGLPYFAFGMAILTLALFAMSELPWESIFKMVIFIALLGLSIKLFDSKADSSMLMIAGGIVAISLGLLIFAKSGFDWENGLTFVGTILAISLVTILLGAVGAIAMIGAASMIVIAASVLIFAFALDKISKLEITIDSIISFTKSAAILALGIAALTPIAAIAMIGAVLMIPVGVSALILAGAIALISAIKIDENNISSFSSSMLALALAFVKIIPFAAIGAVAAALMIVIASASFITAGVLFLISKMSINDKKIDMFANSLTKLVDTFDNFSLFSLAKSVAKAAMIVPITIASYYAAATFEKIQKLNIKESQIATFGVILTKFLDVTTNAIANSVGKLKQAEPGIDALTKIVGVSSKLVDVITAYSNMNYNEYAVKNGKLVLVATKKISDKQIAQVGTNVGKLIQGLLQPLSIISSDSDVWDFGNGVKVKNPFAGGWFGTDNNSGVNRLKSIGEAFLPLVESISKVNNSSLISDKNAQQNFNTAIISIVSSLGTVFDKISKFEMDDVEDSIESINDFFEIFSDVDDKKFKTLNDSFTNFLNSLSDKAKFDTINQNLTSLKNNFKDIVATINTLNIDKAMALERNLKLMTEEKSSKALLEVVEKLKELIGILVDKQTGNTQPTQVVYQNPAQQIMREKEKENNDLQNLISAVETQLSSINAKLNGKLKVVMVEGNMNKI